MPRFPREVLVRSILACFMTLLTASIRILYFHDTAPVYSDSIALLFCELTAKVKSDKNCPGSLKIPGTPLHIEDGVSGFLRPILSAS